MIAFVLLECGIHANAQCIEDIMYHQSRLSTKKLRSNLRESNFKKTFLGEYVAMNTVLAAVCLDTDAFNTNDRYSGHNFLEASSHLIKMFDFSIQNV